MRFFLLLLLLVFFLSLVGLGLIFIFVPPKIDGVVSIPNLTYFFTSLFLCLALGLSLMLYSAGLGVQKFTGSRSVIRTETNRPKILLRASLRRGILFGFLVCLLLGLRLLGIFNFLNFVLLIGIVGLVEFYFSNR